MTNLIPSLLIATAISLVLLAVGVYFLWKRPTGRQYVRELREREF